MRTITLAISSLVVQNQLNFVSWSKEAVSTNTTSRPGAATTTGAHGLDLTGWDTITVPVQSRPNGIKSLIIMWTRPFTQAYRIPVFKRVWIYLALMTVYSLIVDWIAGRSFPSKLLVEAGTVSFSGLVLGLLLVFRTNSAYEGWCEGLKLWGQLVNDSRNLCLKVRSMVPVRDQDKMRFGELVISFAYALKHHLRCTKPSKPLPGVGVLPDVESKHIPLHIAGKVYDQLLEWHNLGLIDGMKLLQLDGHARALMDIAGGCERIKNSPLALSYRAFMRQGIALTLLIQPWYLANQMSVWCSLPLILISAYFLIGIELIAEDIEDPFRYDGDDHLPLDAICVNIKNTVGGIMQVRKDQKFTRSIEIVRPDLLKG